LYLLPILEEPNLPRAAIWAPLPHAGLVQLAFDELIERACKSLAQGGQRLAVLSPHEANLAASQNGLAGIGVSREKLSSHLVTPVGCESVTRLLMDRSDRPDAVFITDDNLIQPFLRGLESCGVRPKRDVYVLGHCNWPRPIGAAAGIDHIGFDVREILAAGKECIEAQRAGEESPRRIVKPRFASELLESLPTAS